MVRGRDGQPLPGALVTAVRLNGGGAPFDSSGSDYSNEAGRFALRRLTPGSYSVRITPLNGNVGGFPMTPAHVSARLEAIAQPNMSRDETSKYSDPLPNETSRQFSFVMDCKSVITFPSYPYVLPDRGWWEVRGLAWSGRGRITRVDVSTDAGRTWAPAELQEPVLSKCTTRFRFLWNWDGGETLLMSRAVDDTRGDHLRVVRDGRPCGCGRRGCFEQYASGSALVAAARERLADRLNDVIKGFDFALGVRYLIEDLPAGRLRLGP